MSMPPMSPNTQAIIYTLPDIADIREIVMSSADANTCFEKIRNALEDSGLWGTMTEEEQRQLKGYFTRLYKMTLKNRFTYLYDTGAIRPTDLEKMRQEQGGLGIKVVEKKKNPDPKKKPEIRKPDQKKEQVLDYSTWVRPIYSTSGKRKPLGYKQQTNPIKAIVDTLQEADAVFAGIENAIVEAAQNPTNKHANVQSIVFAKDEWSLAEARKWLKAHGYKHKYVDEKPNTFRFRQMDPKTFPRYYTVVIEKGLNLVIGTKTRQRNPIQKNPNLLASLYFLQPATAWEIAHAEEVTLPLMRETLDSLVAQGIVIKEGRFYSLTPEGEALALELLTT